MGIKTNLSVWVGPIGDTLSSCDRAILVEWIAKRGRAGHAPARPYEDDSEDLLRRGDAMHHEMCACKTRPQWDPDDKEQEGLALVERSRMIRE